MDKLQSNPYRKDQSFLMHRSLTRHSYPVILRVFALAVSILYSFALFPSEIGVWLRELLFAQLPFESRPDVMLLNVYSTVSSNLIPYNAPSVLYDLWFYFSILCLGVIFSAIVKSVKISAADIVLCVALFLCPWFFQGLLQQEVTILAINFQLSILGLLALSAGLALLQRAHERKQRHPSDGDREKKGI